LWLGVSDADKKRGFSGTKLLENTLVSISTGSTNRCDGPAVRLAWVFPMFADIQLTVGPEYVAKLYEAPTNEEQAKLALSWLLEALTVDTLIALLKETELRGQNKGRNDMQREFREMLGLY
jgi:hypothetical protein